MGKHKAFLSNRSGARPEGLRNGWIFHFSAAARRTHMPSVPVSFRPFYPKKKIHNSCIFFAFMVESGSVIYKNGFLAPWRAGGQRPEGGKA